MTVTNAFRYGNWEMGEKSEQQQEKGWLKRMKDAANCLSFNFLAKSQYAFKYIFLFYFKWHMHNSLW